MTLAATAPSILSVFDDALARAGAGKSVALTILDERGTDHPIDPAGWCRPHLRGDRSLLARCSGATLDVGCGPGRLTDALGRLGHPALGIDVSATAVRLARARGASVLHRDVFGALPGQGRWRHLLLADGNIGIGGDPARLLRRCRDLVARSGRIHVELAAPGTRSWAGQARIRDRHGVAGAMFRWAVLSVEDLPATAAATGLHITETWTEADRWFATLTPA